MRQANAVNKSHRYRRVISTANCESEYLLCYDFATVNGLFHIRHYMGQSLHSSISQSTQEMTSCSGQEKHDQHLLFMHAMSFVGLITLQQM